MAFLDQPINASEIPEQDNNFDPLPAGWYTAAINGADLRTTKAGNGQFIAVRYDITGPSHQGRVVWGNINIKNPNATAEQIGRQQLGYIMRAIGLESVQDTDQLVGGNLQIKLKVTKSEQYGDGNDVSGFKALEGSAPPPVQPQAQQESKPAASTPPWQK